MLKDAIRLANMGFSVIWLKNRSKAPVGDDWTQLPTKTEADLRDTYIKGRNMGVRLGEQSRIEGLYLHVIDMDIRDPEIVDSVREQVEKLLESKISAFPTVISGSGGASRHFYFLADRPYRSRKLWHTEEKSVGPDGKKHWAAEIELFGTGKQVALPPSIHPDTGKEYRWQEDFVIADLPVLDGDLLDELTGENDEIYGDTDAEPIGLSYAEAEDYLSHLDLATWCDDRVGWVKVGMALHHEFGGHKDAFAAWCDFSKQLPDRFDLKVCREQWRSFGKSKRAPVTMATIIEAANEAVYIDDWEGAADEFNEDEDVDEVPYERPTDREIERMFREDDPAKVKVEEDLKANTFVKGIPSHLLTVPGVLGHAVRHYNETSTKTQPQFAVQTALALGSVVLGRNWTTNMSNFTSLYLVNLGETGGGKEFARKFLQNTLFESDMATLIGPTRYASEAGFISEAVFRPRHVTVYDEFGRLLKSTMASGSTHLRDVQSIMMSAFGQLDGIISPVSYSTNGKTKEQIATMRSSIVRRPAITMLGLSTPETFFDALSQDEVADGFLNRILVVNSREEMKVEQPRTWKPIPLVLKEWIKDYGGVGDPDFDEAESAGEVEEPEMVPFTTEAMARLIEIEQHVIDEIKHFRDMRLNGLWSRSKELAQRIALIVALSRDRKKVGVDDLNWAWDYVRFYTEEMCEKAMTMLGSNPAIRVAEHLAEQIEGCGRKGMTMRDMNRLNRAFNRMMSRDKAEVIDRLKTAHGIVFAKVKSSAKGRHAERYIHEDYIRE